MRTNSRRKRTGRRRVEEGEFCRNCNRLKHDQEMHALRDEVELLRNRLEKAVEALEGAYDSPHSHPDPKTAKGK